jgi:hypothetical protein
LLGYRAGAKREAQRARGDWIDPQAGLVHKL